MTTAPATTGRNPLSPILHLVIGGAGALAFVLAFFTKYGDFSGSNILVALLALVFFVKPRAVSAWVLVAVSGAYVLSALTSLLSYDLGGRGVVYWLTFVLLLVQLAASVVAALIEAGMISRASGAGASAFGGGYGTGGPGTQGVQGVQGYGAGNQGAQGYDTGNQGTPGYGPSQPGYAAPSPGYAAPGRPGQGAQPGYGQGAPNPYAPPQPSQQPSRPPQQGAPGYPAPQPGAPQSPPWGTPPQG